MLSQIKFVHICFRFSDIREHVRHVEKAVATKEPRYMSRVIRGLVTVRRRLNQTILRKLLHGYLVSQTTIRDELTQFLDEVGTCLVNSYYLAR